MKKLLTVAILAGLLLPTAIWAQNRDCYVHKTDGTRQKGEKIEVSNAQGDIVLHVDGRLKVPFKRAAYRFVTTPKPRELDQLDQLMEQEKYQDVVKNAPALFETYKFLGWGDYLIGVECEARLALKQVDEAKKVFSKANAFAGANTDMLYRAQLLLLIEDKQFDKAEEILNRMITSKRDQDAAFAFNMRGQLNLAKGQKKQAVLEYLKTLLVFDAQKAPKERAEAKKQAVAIMKELKDPRVGKIEAMD
jgi:tetratricopeptide (TPR) repeat protein